MSLFPRIDHALISFLIGAFRANCFLITNDTISKTKALVKSTKPLLFQSGTAEIWISLFNALSIRWEHAIER
jgi:hypothetical protein